jgi:hypothetical protein
MLDLNQPVVKLNTPSNAAGAVAWTMEMPHNINLGCLLQQVTIVKPHSSTHGAPAALSDVIDLFCWKVNGTPQRSYKPDEAFGRQALFALDDASLAGTVQYFEAGVAVVLTSALDGIFYGELPVLIGSEADVALKAQIVAETASNTVTTVFHLPHSFAQDFRKSYAATAAMALPTAFGNQSGAVVGNLGGVILELSMKALPATVTSVSISGNVEYDTALALPNQLVRLLKMKRLAKQYSAAGDIEVADQIKNVAGESVQYISLLTASASPVVEKITKVVIKQGNQILRTLTWEENVMSLRKAGINVDAIPRNRFDIIFDRQDDPTSGQGMNPNQELSIMATLATSAGSGSITILTGIYGGLE